MRPDLKTLLGTITLLALLASGTPGWAQRVSLAPGYYRIRGLESGLCAGAREAAGLEAGHLVLRPCDTNFLNYMAIIPVRAAPETYTIRPFAYARLSTVPTRLEHCVTRARGVVAGAPRTDIQPCGFRGAGASWCEAGAIDQTFAFMRMSPGPPPSFRVTHWQDGRATYWDVRDHGRDAGTDVLLFSGTGGANQLFELTYDRPLDTADDLACLPRQPAAPVALQPQTGPVLVQRASGVK